MYLMKVCLDIFIPALLTYYFNLRLYDYKIEGAKVKFH